MDRCFSFSFWLRILLSLSLFLGVTAAWAEVEYPGQNWENMTAEAFPRWSESKLHEADEYAAKLKTDAYLVVQDGKLVHEYGDTHKPMNLASVRKSLLSILFGIYVERGMIDLDKSLADLGINDWGGLTEKERSATVRQLLMSRSGVYHQAAFETDGERKNRPARGSHAPGTFFYYNNWDFNALGAIFLICTGKTVFEALQTDLAEPLHFQDFNIHTDTQLVTDKASQFPAYVMLISARDLARVGLMMARNGRWLDQQILPAVWISESTAGHSKNRDGDKGFGYMWWVAHKVWPFWHKSPKDVFFGWGHDGQFLVVDSRHDLVIVHRIDNTRLDHGEVTPESFGKLLFRILAASTEQQTS